MREEGEEEMVVRGEGREEGREARSGRVQIAW